MIIVLVGYTGSGKTNIGKKLAKKLDLNFIDLNQFIETKEGLSISKILEKKGDIYFRKIEAKYFRDIIKNNKELVFSLGAGTPCYSDNSKYLSDKNIKSIYLKSSINSLVNKLFEIKYSTPNLSENYNKDELKNYIAKHLFERDIFYKKSQFLIDCDNKSEENLISEILIKLDK